jgi:hypothetical protein
MAEGLADRPATTLADFADGEGAITWDAAIVGLMTLYGWSEGGGHSGAQKSIGPRHCRGQSLSEHRVQYRVIRNGYVRWDYIAEYDEDGAFGLDGEPIDLAPYRDDDRNIRRELRINAKDLQRRIERQVGKPPVPTKSAAHKPDQKTLNEQFLVFAEKDGWKRKRTEDPEGKKFLEGMGAVTRQIKAAYRYLADHDLAYGRGRPRKSST